MLKLTVSYPDETELLPFLRRLLVGYKIISCKPPLGRSADKGPKSDYYKRYLWIREHYTKSGIPYKM